NPTKKPGALLRSADEVPSPPVVWILHSHERPNLVLAAQRSRLQWYSPSPAGHVAGRIGDLGRATSHATLSGVRTGRLQRDDRRLALGLHSERSLARHVDRRRWTS